MNNRFRKSFIPLILTVLYIAIMLFLICLKDVLYIRIGGTRVSSLLFIYMTLMYVSSLFSLAISIVNKKITRRLKPLLIILETLLLIFAFVNLIGFIYLYIMFVGFIIDELIYMVCMIQFSSSNTLVLGNCYLELIISLIIIVSIVIIKEFKNSLLRLKKIFCLEIALIKDNFINKIIYLKKQNFGFMYKAIP